METFKEIFKYLFAIALMLGVLGITAIILYSINIGYGPVFQEMNNDGVTTYKDFFDNLTLLSKAWPIDFL